MLSGVVKRGERVKILGENYSMEDEEDMLVSQVSKIMICQGRYKIDIEEAHSGNIILLDNLD